MAKKARKMARVKVVGRPGLGKGRARPRMARVKVVGRPYFVPRPHEREKTSAGRKKAAGKPARRGPEVCEDCGGTGLSREGDGPCLFCGPDQEARQVRQIEELRALGDDLDPVLRRIESNLAWVRRDCAVLLSHVNRLQTERGKS